MPRRRSPKKSGRPRSTLASKTALSPSQLRWTCPPIAPTSRNPGLTALLGQERPLEALRTGLNLYAPGYHVFVSGTVGAGRTRLVCDLIERGRPVCRPVPDRVFVSNFVEPNRPRLLTLARGQGTAFRDETRALVRDLQESLRVALRSRTHQVSHDLVLQSGEEREKRLMSALDRQARKEGFRLVQFPGAGGGMMADIYPEIEGEAVNPEAIRELVSQGKVSHSAYVKLRARRDRLMDRLEEVTDRLLKIHKDIETERRRMDSQVAERVVDSQLRPFRQRWSQEGVGEFLNGLREAILQDLEPWLTQDAPPDAAAEAQAAAGEGAAPPPPPPLREEPLRFLGVEVHVVKSQADDACPLVVETHPTYANLFGVVESSREGAPSLAQVHPGALLRADGGYLVLRLNEIMVEPGVWAQLKRALKVGRVEIREFDPNSGVTSGSLQPEAVPIDIKVVLIGDLGTYETLAVEDPQFLQTFKVHAEFDTVLPATKGNMRRYANLIDWFRRREGLLPFSGQANAAVVEHGARLAGRQDRLSARYGELADLAREASFLARGEAAAQVTRAHVEAAELARERRADLTREAVEREFRDGYLLVQTQGSQIGQVNALTVLESDGMAFGKPSRITAAVGVGAPEHAGVVNIEREAELSGPLHDKGVMILQGYLLQHFAKEQPLNLRATICFEQTYGGVDGDSATVAELCALLSSLAGLPLRQGLGITGSMNQLGQIQAVSGVNEKIQGFFRLCRSQGLRRRGGPGQSPGVIIPKVNVKDLMLPAELVEAVNAGRFCIHAVERAEEVMALLSDRDPEQVREQILAGLAAAGQA